MPASEVCPNISAIILSTDSVYWFVKILLTIDLQKSVLPHLHVGVAIDDNV